MSRIPSRARAAGLLATGLAVASVLTACGETPDPSAPANLFEALPPTASGAPLAIPPSSTTAAPTTTRAATAPTTTGKAKPATARPPRRTRTAPDAGTAPAGIGADWKPAGGDEFNGAGLDTTKWGTYDSVGAFGNGLRRSSAISQGGGLLTITASGNVSGGMADSFSQLYGRWEFKARTDLGRGFGSAILLWPDSESTDDGEIDMMEVPNEKRDLANFVLHSGPGGTTQIGTNVPGRFDQWHTFAVEWLPTGITWFVDGVKRYSVTDKARIPTKPMHLAIQLDQGPKENWIAAPDATTPPQLELQVDYARVWSWVQAAAAPSTSRATPPPTGDDG